MTAAVGEHGLIANGLPQSQVRPGTGSGCTALTAGSKLRQSHQQEVKILHAAMLVLSAVPSAHVSSIQWSYLGGLHY